MNNNKTTETKSFEDLKKEFITRWSFNELDAHRTDLTNDLNTLLATASRNEVDVEIIKIKAKEYVDKTFPLHRSTKGLHIRTVAGYAYQDGFKDALPPATKTIEVVDTCSHNDTIFQNLKCSVCHDCGKVIEIDV